MTVDSRASHLSDLLVHRTSSVVAVSVAEVEVGAAEVGAVAVWIVAS